MREIKSDNELLRLHQVGAGLIYNDFSGRGSGGAQYNVLHAASCSWISRSNVNYPKIFFDTISEAMAWLTANRGAEGSGWKRCGTCNAHIPESVLTNDETRSDRDIQRLERERENATLSQAARKISTSDRTEVPFRELDISASEELIDAICEFGKSIPRFTTYLAAADELVYSDGFAFLMACCLDRGTRSETIWKIPYYLKMELGHLNPVQFAQMSIEEIKQALARLPVRPRYMHDAPYTILQLAQIIASEFSGRSEALWEGRSPSEIISTLRRIRGVNTIANMTVNLLHRLLGVPFSYDELRDIDVKPDVHVERIFQRTGLMNRAGNSIQVARRLRGTYPAELDLGSWEIGRRWCHANSPNHEQCPLSPICPRKDGTLA